MSLRLHQTGEPPRRGSVGRLAPLGSGQAAPPPPKKKEWTVADARALEAQIDQTNRALSDAEERRLARAIRLMRNVPLFSAFSSWLDWVEASFEARGAARGAARTAAAIAEHGNRI